MPRRRPLRSSRIVPRFETADCRMLCAMAWSPWSTMNDVIAFSFRWLVRSRSAAGALGCAGGLRAGAYVPPPDIGDLGVELVQVSDDLVEFVGPLVERLLHDPTGLRIVGADVVLRLALDPGVQRLHLGHRSVGRIDDRSELLVVH